MRQHLPLIKFDVRTKVNLKLQKHLNMINTNSCKDNLPEMKRRVVHVGVISGFILNQLLCCILSNL